MQVLAPADRPKDGALIATLRGQDRQAKPILLLAHVDVVEAKREDWVRDPFTLVEEDGWFYARGASDDKAMAAVFTDSLIRYKREGFRPRRDIKLALTCGEETPETFNGVQWLIRNHPDALQAAFALNEGAGGELDVNGEPTTLQIQAGEKVYQDFTLETTNVGGHSARPTKNNAISHLAAGLARLADWQFPISINPVTRAYFEAQAKPAPTFAADIRAVLKNPPDQAAADKLWEANPGWNSMLRTTCVATMVNAGHAPNALPQRARANVNCRILPGGSVDGVRETLVKVLADDNIKVTAIAEPGWSVGAAATDAADSGAGRQGGRAAVAWRGDCAHHVGRGHRRPFPECRRHADLRFVWHVPRPGRQPGARAERADPRQVADGRPQVSLRSREDVREPARLKGTHFAVKRRTVEGDDPCAGIPSAAIRLSTCGQTRDDAASGNVAP